MSERQPHFLGRGWRFPPRFDLALNANGEAQGSGEVAMVETYLGHLRGRIEDAILYFEPRIKVETIEFETSRSGDGYLMIRLDYRIPTINSRSNMVYPFYIGEGTNVRAAWMRETEQD